MWRVVRHDALRSYDSAPPQSSDVTPEVIESLAAALNALRDLVAEKQL